MVEDVDRVARRGHGRKPNGRPRPSDAQVSGPQSAGLRSGSAAAAARRARSVHPEPAVAAQSPRGTREATVALPSAAVRKVPERPAVARAAEPGFVGPARPALGIFQTCSSIVALPSPCRDDAARLPPPCGANGRARSVDAAGAVAAARTTTRGRHDRDRRDDGRDAREHGRARPAPRRRRATAARSASADRSAVGDRQRALAQRRRRIGQRADARPASARRARARVRAGRSSRPLQVLGEAGEPAARPRLDGAERQAEMLRNLTLREAVAVGEPEHRALALGQRLERQPQPEGLVGRDGELLGRRAARRPGRPRAPSRAVRVGDSHRARRCAPRARSRRRPRRATRRTRPHAARRPRTPPVRRPRRPAARAARAGRRRRRRSRSGRTARRKRQRSPRATRASNRSAGVVVMTMVAALCRFSRGTARAGRRSEADTST